MSNIPHQLAYGAFGLSEEFLKAGHTVRSIQMLEGLCAQMDHVQAGSLYSPLMQIKCRLRLAMIYCKYTDNIEKAKGHLEKAQIILPKLRNDMIDEDDEDEEGVEKDQIKLKLYAYLGRVYILLCDGNLARRSFERGLEVSHELPEGQWNNLFWQEYFRSQLALTMIYTGDHSDAMSLLKKGIKEAENTSQLELAIMYSLTVVQAELLRFTSGPAVEKFLRKAESMIERLGDATLGKSLQNTEISDDQRTKERDEVIKNTPRLLILIAHVLILRATYLLHIGDTNSLKGVLKRLEIRLKQLKEKTKTLVATAYDWMNHEHFFTVSLVLCTMYHRMNVNIRRVREAVSRTSGRIQESLLKIEEVAKNYALDSGRSDEVNLLLFLQFLMLQENIITQLSSCEFSHASQDIMKATKLLQQYPHMFERYRFNVHVLITLYALAVDEHEKSQAHLNLVVNNALTLEVRRWGRMMRSAAGISNLMYEQNSGNASPEVLAQKKEHLFIELDELKNSNHESGHAITKVIVSFLRGILCNSNDASKDAIGHLTDSMALCENKVKNTQIMAQIFLELGKIYFNQNNDMWKDYIQDACKRSVESGDLAIRIPSIALALQCGYDFDVKMLQNDVNNLSRRKHDARQGREHNVILNWIHGVGCESYDILLEN